MNMTRRSPASRATGLTLAFVALVSISACSKPKDTVIPTDPAKWSELADQVKSLNDEDRRLLAAYLAKTAIAGALSHSAGVPIGTTVGAAIDQERASEAADKLKEAQAEALKARALAQRKAEIDKMSHAITFALVSKRFVPQNIYASQYSDRVQFVFAIQNNTDKEISGIKGVLHFKDMFGATIEDVGLSLDDGFAAHASKVVSEYGKDLNQFKDGDQKLGATDMEKMKVNFEPEMIVFSDGTTQKAIDAP